MLNSILGYKLASKHNMQNRGYFFLRLSGVKCETHTRHVFARLKKKIPRASNKTQKNPWTKM